MAQVEVTPRVDRQPSDVFWDALTTQLRNTVRDGLAAFVELIFPKHTRANRSAKLVEWGDMYRLPTFMGVDRRKIIRNV